MKNHHAMMALAFAGWYFVVAPYQKPDASMSKWDIKDHYDTECDCQLYKNSLALVVSNAMKAKGQTQPDETQARLLAGECVEGDDPRLKQ